MAWRMVVAAAAVAVLSGCAAVPPAITAQEYDTAVAQVLAASLRLEAFGRICSAIDDDWRGRVAVLEADWRGRQASLLSAADARYRAALAADAAALARTPLAPLAAELSVLPAVGLRVDALHAAGQAVRGAPGAAARDAAGQARICSFELARYDDSGQDIALDTPAMAALRREGLGGSGGATAAVFDAAALAVPVSGRERVAGYRTGTSLLQAEKLLASRQCRNPVLVQLEETESQELYVAACDNRRHVIRCELRSCRLESATLPRPLR
ncbi:MAG: hypothetical protein ACOY3X_09690 [Pseudomonadota bacterium]